MHILLVCTANRCRSVMAETLCRHVADQMQQPVFVLSAGLKVKRGERADPLTIRLLQRHGFAPPLYHRSRRVQEVMHHAWDLILVMEPEQRSIMLDRYPQYRGKIFCLDPHLHAIKDPFRQSWQTYQQILAQMQLMMEHWVQRLVSLYDTAPHLPSDTPPHTPTQSTLACHSQAAVRLH